MSSIYLKCGQCGPDALGRQRQVDLPEIESDSQGYTKKVCLQNPNKKGCVETIDSMLFIFYCFIFEIMSYKFTV